VVCVGFESEKLKSFLTKKFPKMRFSFVENKEYQTTNYIYSMYLARNFLDDDLIIAHCDLVFDEKNFSNIYFSKNKNAVLVSNKPNPPEKDFKAKIEKKHVKKIGVNLKGTDCFFLIPLYKVSKKFALKWLQEMEKFVQEGKTSCYAEDALNNLLNSLVLSPVFFEKETAFEVDDFNDLKKAKTFLGKN
jgi:L-glutamine-phosphate cytidylyltransferase